MKQEFYVSTLELKFASDSQPGAFEGYASVFGNVDAYGDVIQKGAFKETLRDWRKQKRLPPMLLQHGGGMFGGAAEDLVPIGKWEGMEEDDTGLSVRGRLINLDTERGKGVYGAMREGVLDGISIGYRAKEFALGTKPDEPRRTLKKIELVEASIVTLPANDKARVSAVKMAIGSRLTSADCCEIEATLRRKGLSQKDAVRAVSGFKEWLSREAGAPDMEPREEVASAVLADLVRRNIATLATR